MNDFQRRVVHTEFRAAPDGAVGRITAKVLNYNVVDDYETTFAPGVFRASMDQRMPRIVWSHDWAEPLGRWERYIDDDNSLTLIGQLDDFDAVPRAKQAWAQLQSGTIDQFSVGFMPEEAAPAVVDGRDVLTFTRGRLEEASLVLVGAVPGTELVSLRAPRVKREIIVVRDTKVTVEAEALAQLLAEVESGDTPAPAALAMLIDDSPALAATDEDDAAAVEPPAESEAPADQADDEQPAASDTADDQEPAVAEEAPAEPEVPEVDEELIDLLAVAESVLDAL